MDTTSVEELQHRIIRLLMEDNKSTPNFEFFTPVGKYIQNKPAIVLRVTTYNPVHGQSFLLGKFNGTTKEDCLRQVLELITKPPVNSYTVQWALRENPVEGKQSYFTGSSMLSALDKFYYDREEIDFIVYSCKLNPIE